MNIFQVKCDDQGLKIDLLNENKIELKNVDKYVRNIINELKLNGERNKNILLELQEEVKENYDKIRKLNEKFQEIKSFEIESKSIKSMIEKEFDKLKLNGERKQKELERKFAEQTGKIDLLNEEIVKMRNVDKYTKDDVERLKLELERKQIEIDKLKLDGEKKQVEIDKLNKKLQEIELKFEIEIKSKIEKEIDKLKLDGERKEKELERKCAEQTGKIDLLNEEIVKLRNVDKYTREDVDKLKLDGERNKKSIGTLEKKCEEKRNKQTEMRTMSNRIDQTMKNVKNKLLEIEIINQNKMINGEFVWRIDKINDKMKDAKNGINTRIFSDSFYTHKHGYKMCLRVDPYGDVFHKGIYLSVGFYLMKGEFDDILQWPFKYDVTFSLVNQQTRLDHVSKTKKYINWSGGYDKPTRERHFINEFGNFIKLQELSTNANLTRNNQIFIKCSVNISS